MIRNPEVAALVPLLLDAAANPAGKNGLALDTLLRTVFVNTIDAASLVSHIGEKGMGHGGWGGKGRGEGWARWGDDAKTAIAIFRMTPHGD